MRVPDLPERYLFDLRTECNLACPMCLLHGAPDTPEKDAAIGKMSLDDARRILDEIMAAKPLVQPSMWGEPLLAKNFKEHVRAMKERGITVAFNTNGLTLREHSAQFLIDEKVDAVFFSLDATTPETLKKVRGIDKLDKIANALQLLIRLRDQAGAVLPRVGATFTVQSENAHEREEFVDRWIKVADLVRVGFVFENGRLTEIEEPTERQPCAMLYQTMPIHYNGDVSICCWDSHRKAIMGNVLTDGGVKAVWQGEKFQEVRRHHEAGEFDKVPFCRDCNAWPYLRRGGFRAQRRPRTDPSFGPIRLLQPRRPARQLARRHARTRSSKDCKDRMTPGPAGQNRSGYCRCGS
jgi:radical SAM protein with 4Fe4S-binding SPASM domain